MSDSMSSPNPSTRRFIPDLVAAQAAVAPNAVAVVSATGSLTYHELEQRANQLAHYLHSLGIGREGLVAVSVERSLEMVVAALGILKAGAAYLPLDPAAPQERTGTLLRDAGISAVITRSGLAEHLLGEENCPVVRLDADAAPIASFPKSTPTTSLTADSLAYVIYTSGSSGQPKGVEVTHGALRNLVEWHLSAFQVTAADRAAHSAALGFDASVWELWPYLAAGAAVCLAADSVRNNPHALRDWMLQEKISIAFLVTPLAERMLLLPWPASAPLRILLTGADTLRHRPAPGLPFTLVNNYGPTEFTVVATSGVVEPAESTQPPSIGRPIANASVYILDEAGRPVAPGTAGELYLGGASLARGYRKQPALTAERFVPNPFQSEAGSRLYRTGDLARMLPNGEVEFLGRLDEQVKIRGYRVEPGEIVTALDAHPEVETSAVVVAEANGDRRLIAYVVLSGSARITASALRQFLLPRLPEYMVPSAFVRVPFLPITANGKLDRAALPQPATDNLLPEEDYVAPRTVIEERLATVIAPLLHVDRVGGHDNFFLLGGHSLLGTQLLARITTEFGVDLTLLSLFDHPTLAEMSAEIEKLIVAKVQAGDPVPAFSGEKR
jgi:amino acid adenylation domain-containing protein